MTALSGASATSVALGWSGSTGIYKTGGNSFTFCLSGVDFFTFASGGGTSSNTGVWKVGSGSTSAPGYGFNAQTNMGMYRAGTDDLRFCVAGADKFFLSGSGMAVGSTGTAIATMKTGTSALVSGSKTITDSDVTTSTKVFITDTATSLTNVGTPSVVVYSGSFIVTSSNVLDAASFNYLILK